MLVTMKEIVDAAREGRYCVPAPNYNDVTQLYAAADAAVQARSPLILDIGRMFATEDRALFQELACASRSVAERIDVPCAINLDHGSAYEHIVQAMFDGCTSVMADRSSLPFEENVAQVAEIVRIAHAVGVSVESELGHVGTNEDEEALGGLQHHVETDEEKRALYTNPEEAVRYVEETGVDCLAVAVGTVHGFYPEGFVPSVDFELLAELREKVPVPLVIHGGSGSGDEILKGMAPYASKLNVGHDLFKAFGDGIAAAVESGEDPVVAGSRAYTAELVHYMEVLGSANKA